MKYLLYIFLMVILFSCSEKNRESKNSARYDEIIQSRQKTRIKIQKGDGNKVILSKSDTIIKINHFIKNSGNHDLYISKLKTNCECIGAFLDSSHLIPGDSVLLELTLNLRGKHGVVGVNADFNANTEEEYHSVFTKIIVKD